MTESTSEYKKRIEEIKQSIENEPYMAKMREDIAEGISKTGIRQATVEEQFQSVLDETTGKDVISAPELIAARNGELNLKTRLDKEKQEVTAQLAHKAEKAYVDTLAASLANGSPKGVYDTLSELQTAFPTGNTNIYVVTEDGKWYYWNGSAWSDGGTYQATGIADGSVKPSKTSFITLEDNPNFTPVDILTTYTGGLTDGAIWQVGGELSTVSASGYQSNTVLIPVVEGMTYQFTMFRGRLFFFNDTKIDGLAVIKDDNNAAFTNVWGTYNVTVPSGYTYMGISVFKSSPYVWPENVYRITQLENEKKLKIPALTITNDNLDPNIIPEPKKTLTGKKVVCFGDSITDLGNYPEHVASRTGATVYNVGFAGCRLTRHPTSTYDAFSMTKLADAISSGNFALQDTANETLNFDNLPTLKTIDFSTVDVITIFYGTNDYAGAISLGTDTDVVYSDFKPAINYIISVILTTYPHIKLLFITPMWRARLYTNEDGQNSDITPNGAGVYLIEYADAMIKVGNLNHIPVLDLYRNGGINIYNYQTYLADGLHPNDVGFEHLGNKIGAFITANV